MPEVIVFTSRPELSAEENLRGFIDACRNQLTVFGVDLDFEADSWDVTAWAAQKGYKVVHRAIFSNLATSDKRRRDRTALREPFKSFSKAYFRYQFGLRPTVNIKPRISALRFLEAAVLEMGCLERISRIDAGVFNRAAQLAGERLSTSSAYGTGVELAILARFMAEHRLISAPLQWANFLKPAEQQLIRVGKQFDERRRARLPSQAALEALPLGFRNATEPLDVIIFSALAILCSAPNRINEVLLLRFDCEVSQRQAGKGTSAYGLRWTPAKGASPMIKWVVPSMAEVVSEAVAKIRRLTESGRQIAKWYEQRPRDLFLPPELEHLRVRRRLTLGEVGAVVFADAVTREAVQYWCKKNAVALEGVRDQTTASFESVQCAVLQLLPTEFPLASRATGLRFSEALFVVPRNLLTSRSPYRCMVEPVTYGHFNRRLGASKSREKANVFERLGLRQEDGEPIYLTTHQIRHYLDTLAHLGGLSQLDVAKWAGRRQTRQNDSYDHVSGRDLVAKLRATVGDSDLMVGPLAEFPRFSPVARDEFAALKVPTAHVTEIGVCIHDYTMSPCQLHRDCINCMELVCVKGDAERTDATRRLRDETRKLLEAAKRAQHGERAGASRWVVHQELTLKRLDELCGIFDDPGVPDGSFIQLSITQQASRIEQAARRRHAQESSETGNRSVGRTDSTVLLLTRSPNDSTPDA